MALTALDWAIVAGYVVFALAVGVIFAKRAGKDVDEFFLSGRSLPWWMAGTSMVATTFAADTPLVITGWVREHGIWMNWLWWCYAIGGVLTVFLFARYWRRGRVMTTAELAELRYGGCGAKALRGCLGLYHSVIGNTLVLCWVLLAASKIMDVLFGVDKATALVMACALAMVYSLLAGFWGVVLTDLLQFAMAMVGSIALAWLSWSAVGGTEFIVSAIENGAGKPGTLDFAPSPGAVSPTDPGFWTTSFAAFAVYLGVAWWAKDGVDGGGVVVQRISASRDEREGVLAALWFQIANYALRPWPWILVALASLIALPAIEVRSPIDGRVVSYAEGVATIEPGAVGDGGERVRVRWETEGDWVPQPAPELVSGKLETVEAGAVLAVTDSERAYPVMMARYLPAGLLGLVVASLLAAFMSTIDTHVNLAASFFVNDVYRRFLAPDHDARHYVTAARVSSVLVLALGALLAYGSSSISDLFKLFIALLAGVGPVYLARWFWWRVRASTEITAMVASFAAATFATYVDVEWKLGVLSPEGKLENEGRLCVVVLFAAACAGLSMLVAQRPDPATLVPFYRRVRPIGWWGPVAALAPDARPPSEGRALLVGFLGGLAATYGALFGLGWALLGQGARAAVAGALALVGAWLVRRSLAGLDLERACSRIPGPDPSSGAS